VPDCPSSQRNRKIRKFVDGVFRRFWITAHAVMLQNSKDVGNEAVIFDPDRRKQFPKRLRGGNWVHPPSPKFPKKASARAGARILEGGQRTPDWNKDVGFRVLGKSTEKPKKTKKHTPTWPMSIYRPIATTQATCCAGWTTSSPTVPQDLLLSGANWTGASTLTLAYHA